MTENQTGSHLSTSACAAQLPGSTLGLRTYSERRRNTRNSVPGPVANTEQTATLPNSAPSLGRQAQHAALHPFFKHCSLQRPTVAPQKRSKRSFTQLHLDVGQANFACINCSVCGLIYAKGEANDEKVHATFHANYTQGVKFQGWQHERVVGMDGRQGRILLVLLTDSGSHLKKVKEICAVVESDLGLCTGWLLASPCQVYLYIASSKHVLGCVVAERITYASPIIPSSGDCCTSGCSTATGANHFPPSSPPAPMSAPPFVKHRCLSSQLPTRSAASKLPLGLSELPTCQEGTASQQQQCSQIMRLGSAQNHSQQHVSFSSSQSSTVPARVMHNSSQPHSKHPRKNLLTRWLATGRGISAASLGSPSPMLADSPISAGSVVATKHGGNSAAASLGPEERDISSPIPIMPFTDVTNLLDDNGTSEASTAMHQTTLHGAQADGSPASYCGPPDPDLAGQLTQVKDEGNAFNEAQHVCHMLAADRAISGQLPGHQQEMSDWQTEQQAPCERDEGMPQAVSGLSVGAAVQAAADRRAADEAHAQPDLGQSELRPHLLPSRLRAVPMSDVVRTDRSQAVKAACGIKVVWVSAQARRQGIATQLLDTARCNCVAGYVVPRSQLAFSQPTQAGRCLAEHYTHSRNFLVYQYSSQYVCNC